MTEALLVSSTKQLNREIISALKEDGIDVIAAQQKRTETFAVQYGSDVSDDDVARIKRKLHPLELDSVCDESLSGGQIKICLGSVPGMKDLRITICSENRKLRGKLRDDLTGDGCRKPRMLSGFAAADSIEFGGASERQLQRLSWWLKRNGILATAKQVYGKDDPRVRICLSDPAQRDRPPGERFAIEVKTDCAESSLSLRKALKARGFPRVRIAVLDPEVVLAESGAIGVDPGPLGKTDATLEVAELVALAGDQAKAAGIDLARHPVRMIWGDAEAPTLYMPLQACAQGTLPPYAGAFPDRFQIVIYSDNRVEGGRLRKSFLDAGFTRVSRRTLSDDSRGFEIHYGTLGWTPELLEQIREMVEAFMGDHGAAAASLALLRDRDEEDTEVEIYAPTAAFRSGALTRHWENPALYKLAVRGGCSESVCAVAAAMKPVGFAALDARCESHSTAPYLGFGGAESKLLERIQELVQQATGDFLPTKKIWPITSRDLRVVLPAEPQMPKPWQAVRPRPPKANKRRATGNRPFLKVAETLVDIGGIELPRRPDIGCKGVPQLLHLGPYCLDQVTAETLFYLAEAILLREPCMLEGTTGTSKSSSILYLCHLLRQPVLRLNLNGSTDSGELVGRYVPETSGGWRFHLGLLVTAMLEGQFLIYDEINLCEPQVIERVNSSLEEVPSLVLTEHDHSSVEPVHEDFRVFGTCNPYGAYSGRQAMSPALKDRFQSYRIVPPAGEKEFLDLGLYLVHGRQPEITVRGQSYCGGQENASLPRLAKIPNFDSFLEALARFHVSLEAAAGGGDGEAPKLGAAQREPIVFSRRGFINTLRFLDWSLAGSKDAKDAAGAAWAALERYYIAKLSGSDDRAVAVEMAAAVGLSPTQWRISS